MTKEEKEFEDFITNNHLKAALIDEESIDKDIRDLIDGFVKIFKGKVKTIKDVNRIRKAFLKSMKESLESTPLNELISEEKLNGNIEEIITNKLKYYEDVVFTVIIEKIVEN